MASTSFDLLDDQTDEEFFDKLVNDDDDIGFAESKPSVVDSDVAKAVFNISISESELDIVDSGSDVNTGGVADTNVLGDADVNSIEDTVVAKQSDSGIPSNVDHGEGSESSDLVDKSSVNLVTGVKEVQWSVFNSGSHVQSGSEFSSEDFFSELGNSSEVLATAGNNDVGSEVTAVADVSSGSIADLGSSSYENNNEAVYSGVEAEQSTNEQDLSSSMYWENLYPGWRYDPSTGQWHQLNGCDVGVGSSGTTSWNVNAQGMFGESAQSTNDCIVTSEQKSDTYHLQETAQSVSGCVAQGSTTASVTNWTQNSQGNVEYPAHIVFDPQYPGWYYDTIAQEWRLLESYVPNMNQSANANYNHQTQSQSNENYGSQTLNRQSHFTTGDGSVSSYNEQGDAMWQTQPIPKIETTSSTFSATSNVSNPLVKQRMGFKNLGSVGSCQQQSSQAVGPSLGTSAFQTFNSSEKYSQNTDQKLNFQPSYLDNQNSAGFPQPPFLSHAQFSSTSGKGRSSAGRPAHALVTFGFGGKLVVMKNNNSFMSNLAVGNQDSEGDVIKVHNLMEVVMPKGDASSFGMLSHDYFHALCQQLFPGPLVGGNVGYKEVNKWIDERIANGGSMSMDYKNSEALRLLLSLLKIACQYLGKLRSPFGTDQALKEGDSPEPAVANLLASMKRSDMQFSEFGAVKHCLLNLPSEAQMQATALEVQRLLVTGKKNEALQFAQEGQLWGPALVLASQLGDQFYGDTVKQMALKQLVAGSPLRTVCLLIAGQPADVFSTASASVDGNIPGYAVASQPRAQIGSTCMLDEWEENLAVITANRTKDDELVVTHLGDCLWKERAEVAAAHVCYLIADANFEPYSDSARLCLLGADHLKCPRTFASPQAIQRTELYEYSKVLGNSQFLLQPLQPYKVVYAHMLAEVGKVADSLKYCQTVLKSPKTGRAPEIDAWKQLASSLEERLKAHQEGGFSANLAPTKLMGKLRNFFDNTNRNGGGGALPPPIPTTSYSTAQHNGFAFQHEDLKVSNSQSTMGMTSFVPSAPIGPISGRTVEPNQQAAPNFFDNTNRNGGGGALPHIPPTPYSTAQHNGFAYQHEDLKVSSSQSTMAMSSLAPSASMEPISGRTAETNQQAAPNRSISEPDFSRNPKKAALSKEANSADMQEKASVSSGSSRFGRFGSQIFQKTVGLVVRSRPNRQAKLGDKNKFYYDEKLKRWVEEGAEPPAEAPALAPPPIYSALQNGRPEQNAKDAPKNDDAFSMNPGPTNQSTSNTEWGSGIPPVPPSSNQFSARGRMSVRSRYVDTFNKSGGASANVFQAPTVPAAKSGSSSNPKFFVPAPVASVDDTVEAGENVQETPAENENPSTGFQESMSSPPPLSTPSSASAAHMPVQSIRPPLTSSSITIQRFQSVDSIVQRKPGAATDGSASLHPPSRRTVSWSGDPISSPSPSKDVKLLASYADTKVNRSSGNDSNSGDDLREVGL